MMTSMARPVLKQFGELTSDDFERHPVWIGCHTADHGQPWYDDTDEETFRPWTEALPADPRAGTLLVQATATLNDGSLLPAFLTPAVGQDLGVLQPHVFVANGVYGFWGGLAGVPEDRRRRFYADAKKTEGQVFPVQVRAAPGLSEGVVDITVQGWTGVPGREQEGRSHRRWWRRGP